MSVYPGGGTPPTSFAPTPAISGHAVHHITGFAFTGSDVLGLTIVALTVIAIGLLMVLISQAGRK